jgi:hypothetical protein
VFAKDLLMRFPLSLVLVFSLVGFVVAGCSSTASPTAGGGHDMLAMAPMEDMPAEVQSAAVTVSDAYRFAAVNPDTLRSLPCYCGCGPIGHKSNYDCYIAGAEASGALSFDSHALGCGICVDITQDAMRLLQEGKSLTDIRAYVDSTYSRYGPSNMP